MFGCGVLVSALLQEYIVSEKYLRQVEEARETRFQDSVHSRSQYGAGTTLADTTSPVHHTGKLPGSSVTLPSRGPNSAFERWRKTSRARSASPGLRRSLPLLVISVAQHHA